MVGDFENLTADSQHRSSMPEVCTQATITRAEALRADSVNYDQRVENKRSRSGILPSPNMEPADHARAIVANATFIRRRGLRNWTLLVTLRRMRRNSNQKIGSDGGVIRT
jgi:hypothetical protein